jgi:hypothetical protein
MSARALVTVSLSHLCLSWVAESQAPRLIRIARLSVLHRGSVNFNRGLTESNNGPFTPLKRRRFSRAFVLLDARSAPTRRLSKSKVSTRCHTTILLLLRPSGVLLHSAHQLIRVKLRLPNEQTAKIPKRISRFSLTPLSQSPKFQLGTETTSLGTPLPPILTQSVLFDVGFDQLRDIIYVIGNREILIKSVCMWLRTEQEIWCSYVWLVNINESSVVHVIKCNLNKWYISLGCKCYNVFTRDWSQALSQEKSL